MRSKDRLRLWQSACVTATVIPAIARAVDDSTDIDDEERQDDKGNNMEECNVP
jgi:hypothetical protein